MGHYGNATTVEDVAQWAGVSIGSVINYMECTMIAILDQHEEFMKVPTINSFDAELAQRFVEVKLCEA